MQRKPSLNFGWVIVSMSFLALALAYAVWYSFSVFFVALLKEFGWSRSIVAGAFSLFVIIHSVIGPVVGVMIDRFGSRRIFLLGASFLGTGPALCSLISSWWQLYAFFGVITAIGVGSIGMVPNNTNIQLWFKDNRGLATGIVSSGIGIGILVCVPSIQYLIIRVGWWAAYRTMALLIPAMVIFMAVVFLRKRPPKILETSFKEKEGVQGRLKDPSVINEKWVSQCWTIRHAVATRQFWLFSLAFLFSSLANQSIFTHNVAFFVDHGLEALLASYIVGIIGIVSTGGKILWGTFEPNAEEDIEEDRSNPGKRHRVQGPWWIVTPSS